MADPKIHLPIDDAWGEIETALKRHVNLVLVAEPGAGKTTRLPPRVSVFVQGKVAVLEPRRLAARAAANRIAFENGWVVGREVGYSVRFDHKIAKNTPVGFYTEGLFLRKMADEPNLAEFSAVILDEFHERSRYTDLAIAVLKETQMLERPDLRLIVMSATIDAEAIASYLAVDGVPAPIVRVPGRTFPIEVTHQSHPLMLATSNEWVDRTAALIGDIAADRKPRLGDILVFLPGFGEIRRLQQALEARVSKDTPILPLHGSLTLDEQDRVLKNDRVAKVRVILATNIAETSLTLDGVGTVVDTGLARVARTDRMGFSQLHLERISMASVRQRGGRSGRQSAGLNYRMWSKIDEASFPVFDEAELKRVDLADSLLDLFAMGVPSPAQLDWFERPEKNRFDLGLHLLADLGAIDGGNDRDARLTDLGRAMAKTGLPARAARIKVEAERTGAKDMGAAIIALLFERDILLEGRGGRDFDNDATAADGYECDLHRRADVLFDLGDRRSKVDRPALHSARQVYTSLGGSPGFKIWSHDVAQELLLVGFPDRVARRRKTHAPQALMVGGRGTELHRQSSVRESEFFFALRGDAGSAKGSSDPVTTLACGLDKNWLVQRCKLGASKQSQIVFDDDAMTAYQSTGLFYRDLPLDAGARSKPPADDVHTLLVDQTIARAERLLVAPPLACMRDRLDFLSAHGRLASSLDEVRDTALREAIGEVLFGQTSIAFLFQAEGEGPERLADAWERAIANHHPDIGTKLRSEAPTHFIAPTGNRFRIEYPIARAPYTEVRLQELFGLTVQPKLASGKVALVFHLLSPGFRPVQVTADIAGFWKGSYFEVRKELRARYPKHAWPDDPLTAPPVAKGRRHH